MDVILKPQKLITINAKTAKYGHLKHVLYLSSCQQPTVMVPVISTRIFLYGKLLKSEYSNCMTNTEYNNASDRIRIHIFALVKFVNGPF